MEEVSVSEKGEDDTEKMTIQEEWVTPTKKHR